MSVPTTPTPRVVKLPGGVELSITEYGDAEADKGTGVLVLHGGAGPRTVAGLAAALSQHAYVIAPVHPGFDGTPRPEQFDSVADLASTYLDLLDVLGLSSVMVIGSSIGGWIAAEMATRDNKKVVAATVLVNAPGIKADPGQEITDVSTLTPVEMGKLAFHNPQFRLDPSTLTEQQRAGMIANQGTLAVYAGEHMYDVKLRGRLHRVDIPVLVVWGEEDGVVPLAYGRTFADSFARARFVQIPETGHFPFIEDPAAFFGALGEFISTDVKPGENDD